MCSQDKVSELPLGPPPPFFEKNLFNLLPAPSVDRAPDNSSFGDVLQQVYPIYRQVRQRPSGLRTGPSTKHIHNSFNVSFRAKLSPSPSWQETPETPETS